MAKPEIRDLLEIAFKPFEYLNLSNIYNKYSTAIDLTLYIFFFVYVCRASLSRFFPANHGNKIGTMLGIILGIAFGITEHQFGFTLRSFGAIASIILLLIITFSIYSLLIQAGVSRVSCIAISIVLVYLSINAVIPEAFFWSDETMLYLQFILFISFIIIAWKLLHLPFSIKAKRNRSPSKVMKSIKEVDTSDMALVKSRIEKLVAGSFIESKQLINMLSEIRLVLHQSQIDAPFIQYLINTLVKCKKKQHDLLTKIVVLEKLDKKLLSLDLPPTHKLRRQIKTLSKERQAEVKKAFLNERKKLDFDVRLYELSVDCKNNVDAVQKCISKAIACLEANDVKKADEWLLKGIKQERRSVNFLKEIGALTNKLENLLSVQLNIK